MTCKISDFYIVMDSDQSKVFFPENHGQHFKLKLNPPLSLEQEQWQVALVDFTPKKPRGTFNVYLSCLKYSQVGDAYEPLLRAFPSTLQHLVYMPVQQTRLDFLEMYIKGDPGIYTSFSKGRTKCTLHFKLQQ